MILSFKPQFINKILDGDKIHTIRRDPHDRWKPGMIIHFATGVRTKRYKQFYSGHVVSIQKIKIEWHHPHGNRVLIDGNILDIKEKIKLSDNDGFDCYEDFCTWFKDDFTGKIIHWTGARYGK